MIEEVSDPQQKGPYLLNHERFHLHVQREKKWQENFKILASPFISQLLNNFSLSSLRPCDMFLNPSLSMLDAAATHICLHAILQFFITTTWCPTTALLLHSLYSLLLFSLTMWLVATNLLCTWCLLLVLGGCWLAAPTTTLYFHFHLNDFFAYDFCLHSILQFFIFIACWLSSSSLYLLLLLLIIFS